MTTRTYSRSVALLAILVVMVVNVYNADENDLHGRNGHKREQTDGLVLNETRANNTTRMKQDASSCQRSALREFPSGLFTRTQRRKGAIITHLLACAYMFVALAVVCDDYFVPSLQTIGQILKLQDDVNGATLLAVGGSAPELFTSIIGVFVTKGDIGIGTILGSAVFNVLFVIGLCGVVTKKVLELSWYPITRDAICYGLSVLALTLIIYDGKVYWYEAVILVLLYPLFIILMYFSPRIEKKVYLWCGDSMSMLKRFPEDALEKTKLVKEDASERTVLVEVKNAYHEHNGFNGGIITKPVNGMNGVTTHSIVQVVANGNVGGFAKTEYENQSNDDGGESSSSSQDSSFESSIKFWQIRGSCCEKMKLVLLLPINAIFTITIPNPDKFRACLPVTFIMSVMWIGGITYILLWMVTAIGDTIGIPDSVMGLTLVAFGSSVPDTFASVIVARQGLGDMAVAHSFGSNVFDILLCLGLPWTVMTLVYDYQSVVAVRSSGLFVSCIVIFALLIVTYILLAIRKFRLDRLISTILLVLYGVFLITAISIELGWATC